MGSQPRHWGLLTFLIPKSSKGKAFTRPPGLRIRITRSQKKELERSSKQMTRPLIQGEDAQMERVIPREPQSELGLR